MDQIIVPDISVIMPVYNAGKYLKDAIDSILNQTFKNFEFFIIDDASNDESVAIITSYNDRRIQFIQKPVNTGYTDSLNMAVALAKGRYIARMDADDISLENRFQLQLAFMEKHPGVLVSGTAYKIIGTEDIVTLPLTFEETKVVSLMHVPVAHPTAFIRKEVFTAYALKYNKQYEPAEDYDLWTRVLEEGRIENLPDVLLLYRRHDQQQSIYRLKHLMEAAVEIRSRQLSKLISFVDKTYDVLFAIDVLTKQTISLTGITIKKMFLLLTDMYESNALKKIFDKKILYQYLREIWLFHVLKFNRPRIKDISLLYAIGGSSLTRMGLLFNLKFFKKIISAG